MPSKEKKFNYIALGGRGVAKNIAAQSVGLGMSFRNNLLWGKQFGYTPIRQPKGCTSLGELEKEYAKKGNRKPRSYRSIVRMNKWIAIQKTWFSEPEENVDQSAEFNSLILAAIQRKRHAIMALDVEAIIEAARVPKP